MKSSSVAASAPPLLEAALLIPLLVDGPAPSQHLFTSTQALCHPWLSPTCEVLGSALLRLQTMGAVAERGGQMAAYPQPARAHLTRCLTSSVLDAAGQYSALAQLLIGTAHPALSTESVGAICAGLTDARMAWVTPGEPSPPHVGLSCLERARRYRVAVAGAQLGVLNAFFTRVPSLCVAEAE